ncbi:MAG: hypothetical protein GY702_23805 [Desulfobulbaceae bacterium]|nr:hypothetical protein [Desulfobulbaceae bacterium]
MKCYTCIGFSVFMILIPLIAVAGPVDYDDYMAAYSECTGAVHALDSEELLRNINILNKALEKTYEDSKTGGGKTLGPKQSKKLAKKLKKEHLDFNKLIKDYQTKCKRSETILKKGIRF